MSVVLESASREEAELRKCPKCGKAGLETDCYVWLPAGVIYEHHPFHPQPPKAFKLKLFCNYCEAVGFVCDPAAPAYEVAMLIYPLDHGESPWEAFRIEWELGHYHPLLEDDREKLI